MKQFYIDFELKSGKKLRKYVSNDEDSILKLFFIYDGELKSWYPYYTSSAYRKAMKLLCESGFRF